MDQRARAENTEPMLAAEPIENAEAREPADAIDRIEPAEPIDRIEPAEPIDRIEPLDPMLRMEPDDPAERDEPGEVRIAPLCCCCRPGCYWAAQQPDDRQPGISCVRRGMRFPAWGGRPAGPGRHSPQKCRASCVPGPHLPRGEP